MRCMDRRLAAVEVAIDILGGLFFLFLLTGSGALVLGAVWLLVTVLERLVGVVW